MIAQKLALLRRPANRERRPVAPRTVRLVATQLIGAAVALTAWIAIGATETAEVQSSAIEGYAYGAIGSLVATLGIPFLIPNLFRNIDRHLRATSGAWSAPLWVGSILPLLFLILGVVWAIASDGPDGASLAFVYTGGVAAGVIVLQVARITDNLATACMGIVPQIAFPLCWAISYELSSSISVAGYLTIGGQVAAWALCHWALRPVLGGLSNLREHAPETLRLIGGAVQLLPHLLAFALLSQGPRLIASLFGDARLQASAHGGMLVVGAGTTVLASLNSLLAVNAQTTPDADVPAASKRFAVRYAVMGSVLPVGVWVGIESARRLDIIHVPALYSYDAALMSAALAGFASYYALSSFILRTGRPWILPVTSVSCSVLYLATGYFINTHEWVLWVGFAGCIALLSIISTALASRFARRAGINWLRLTATTSVGYLPIAMVGLAVVHFT